MELKYITPNSETILIIMIKCKPFTSWKIVIIECKNKSKSCFFQSDGLIA